MNDTWIYDAIRLVTLGTAGLTFAFALATLVVSFKVLTPKPFNWTTFTGSGHGFLFAHILLVSIATQGLVALAMHEVLTRLNSSQFTGRSPALLFLSFLLLAAYWIIYRVELARLRIRRLGIHDEGR